MQFIFHSSVLPQIVPFEFGDEPINVFESVSTLCSINKGDLPIEIWWTLTESDVVNASEKTLTSNDGVVITRTGNKLGILNIESVNARHRGNYTCYAKNNAGVAQHSALLKINGYLKMKKILLFMTIFRNEA